MANRVVIDQLEPFCYVELVTGEIAGTIEPGLAVEVRNIRNESVAVIIDAHCHVGRGDGFSGPWDTEAPLDRYLERADRAGIGHIVLLAAFSDDYANANEAVAALVNRNRARFSALAFVHAVRDRGRILPMVTRAVRVHGFRGIKCHRYDGRITREICETARAVWG